MTRGSGRIAAALGLWEGRESDGVPADVEAAQACVAHQGPGEVLRTVGRDLFTVHFYVFLQVSYLCAIIIIIMTIISQS